jgi:hypothetical protein
MRIKSVYDFDSAYDYYEYLDSLDSESEDYREPDDEEPEENYRETDDRNFMSNDVRFIND